MGRMSVAPQIRALNCTNCGAPLQIRAGGHTLTVVCGNCLSLIDARDPALGVLQTFQTRQRAAPKIPLGVRGVLHGATWEVIGFQVREIVVDSTPYQWSEYLLYNPYKGFRYLTEYDGHWNFVATLRALPDEIQAGYRRAVRYAGQFYRPFQTCTARTVFVLGEFPWQFRVGEAVFVEDYVAPPRSISAERTQDEVVWSQGEYIHGGEIWKAFRLPGAPPPARGIYSNQPSPYSGRVKSIWGVFLILLMALALMAFIASISMGQEKVFESQYTYSTASKGENSFVTPVFELKGRPCNVELTVETDLTNDWAAFGFALINEQTGEGYDFGTEVSYYRGTDSDGSWEEGGRRERKTIAGVPAGRYYLRIEPEMNTQDGAAHSVRYDISLRRDVPSNAFFWIAGLLLLIPPVFVSMRAAGFEKARWQESSFASESGSDEGEEE
jgi:hypothetical protein